MQLQHVKLTGPCASLPLVPETDELKSELVPLTAAVIRRDFPSVSRHSALALGAGSFLRQR